MKPDRKTAMVAGVLFILATAFSLASTGITSPILGASNYLVSASSNQTQVFLGVLLLLAGAISVVLIPATLFPVLKRYSESMALGYLSMRILEAVTTVIDGIALLLLVSAGQQYVNSEGSVAMSFQASGTLWLALHNWIFGLNPIIFGVGGLILYYLLYQHRLIPRWLSTWGIIGVLLIIAFGAIQLFGTAPLYIAVPIAVQEMAMATWFIVKGFTPAVAPTQPTN